MKKLKIIVVNVVLFILLFHVADYYVSLNCWPCGWMYKKYAGNTLVTYLKHYRELHNYSLNCKNEDFTCFSDVYSKKGDESKEWIFRPIENEYAQKSILLFGCSYCYGLGLNDRETFSAKLGEFIPNYRIYNRAKGGWTTSHMLYQLENKDFSDIPNVKFVIYVFIDDHFVRNYNSCQASYTPYYKLNRDYTLEFQPHSLKYIVYPILYRQKELYEKSFYERLYQTNTVSKEIELTKKIIEKSSIEINKKFPNAKYIILRYDNGKDEPYNYMFDELKKDGITVVSLKDLSDKNYNALDYRLSNDIYHPNARAWEEITPLFVKYLRDKGYLKD